MAGPDTNVASGSNLSNLSKETVITIKECILCFTSDNDESIFGKFYTYNSKYVHEFCLVFSNNLYQRGIGDKRSFFGYWPEDIENELVRGSQLICSYCKKKGATVHCWIKMCDKQYHFPCSLKNKCLNQYFESFRSYCVTHKPRQSVPKLDIIEFFCRICFEHIPREDTDLYVHAPCCFNNIFHRTCLQSYALSSGMSSFSCPLCKNSSSFTNQMLLEGIYVPLGCPSWERVPNAFSELLHSRRCSAPSCLCERGREFPGIDMFYLLSCHGCGVSCHRMCGDMDINATSWLCPTCQNVLAD